jgi:hypothetical protein
MQRPYGDPTPLYGLYALRGWDYFTHEYPGASGQGPVKPIYDSNGNNYPDVENKSYPFPSKRLLMVVQGLQLPYQPSRIELHGNVVRPSLKADSANHYRRAPEGSSDAVYRKERARTLGLHFWSGPSNRNVGKDSNPNQFKLYDMWFEEGFTPKEVRAILGLDPKRFPDSALDVKIPELYSTQ